MTMLFFEGFDIHRSVATGLDAGGDQDVTTSFWGGTPIRYHYTPGYLQGQALHVDGGGGGLGGQQSATFRHFTPPARMRVGMWAKASANSATGDGRMLVVGQFALDQYAVNADTTGRLYLTRNTTPITGKTTPLLGTTWRHYELFSNTSTGQLSLSVNGVVVLTATAAPITTRTFSLSDPGNLSSWSFDFDHFYMTNGDPIGTDEVLGVSISAAQDRYEGSNGFRGTVIMEGDRYVTEWQSALVSSLSNLDVNVTNVTNFFFMSNPSLSAPWTLSAFKGIESWGLCFQENNESTIGDRVRLAGMCLNYLDNNDGSPIITYYHTSAATQFSGPWTKSDPNLTYGAHVNQIPRDPTHSVLDSLSLFIAAPGCILFALADSPDDTGPEMIKVGLTFAEEFRVDYRDWVRVTGTGNSFDSLFVSGYSVLGEGNKKFQDNFVTVNYENVPTGACYIQGLWDYSENGDTGRWSMRQSIDNKGGDYRHGFRRLKIRGHGKAMQLRVTNKGDTPFVVNGWSMFITGNATV